MYHSMFCTLEEDEHLPLHSWILCFWGLLGHSLIGNALRCVQAHTDCPVCACVSPTRGLGRSKNVQVSTMSTTDDTDSAPSLWLLLYIPII